MSAPDAAAVIEVGDLRVVFERRGDRFGHRVEVRAAADAPWLVACYSLEGEADDDWPPSPPFQQLHVERRPRGPVVLLVGMAGRTHWSGAVAEGDDGGVQFDFAARAHQTPLRLGSSYVGVDSGAFDLPAWTAGEATEIVNDAATLGGRTVGPRSPLASPPATWTWKYVVGPSG